MPEIKLSKEEKQVLQDAKDLEHLEHIAGWRLMLGFLEQRAVLAEQRRDANLSRELAWDYQVIARERRATVASVTQHLEEVKKARREILSDMMQVPEGQIDEALTEETFQ